MGRFHIAVLALDNRIRVKFKQFYFFINIFLLDKGLKRDYDFNTISLFNRFYEVYNDSAALLN